MKKFKLTVAMLILLLCLTFASLPVKAHAEQIFVADKLQYYELDCPIAACKEGDTVYVAQEHSIIIYHDNSFEVTDLGDFTVCDMFKYHDVLLLLGNDGLYCYSLASKSLPENPIIENARSFSVQGDYFCAIVGSFVNYYHITDPSQFTFERIYTQNSYKLLSESVCAVALTNENNFYYFEGNDIHLMKTDTWQRRVLTIDNGIKVKYSVCVGSELFFADDKCLYRMSENKNNSSYLVEPLFDIVSANLKSISGIFTADAQKVLICDSLGNRIVEYDCVEKQFTRFEVSFTKINCPENFSFVYNPIPQTALVTKDTELYEVDLDKTLVNGYFVFKGIRTQKEDEAFLVLNQIDDRFYFVMGSCTALLLKEDYQLQSIAQASPTITQGFFTVSANVYRYPFIDKALKDFRIERNEKVNINAKFTYKNTDFYSVEYNGNCGYIPVSYVKSEVFKESERNNYYTAMTAKHPVNVYEDDSLTTVKDTIEPSTQIIVNVGDHSNLLITYGDGKTGFVSQDDVVKNIDYTKRNVAVIAIVLLSLTITIIYLEYRFLTNKPIKIKKIKRKTK